MKKTITLTLIGAASALALSATAASAQDRWNDHGPRYEHGGWTSINQRQAQLERQIDRGLRRGDLTRREAMQLRTEFRQIAWIENRYRRDGLSSSERMDLDRRFDRLQAKIRFERTDNDYGRGDYGRGDNDGYGYGYGHDQPGWRH